jgi:hypothetical protein
MALAKIFILYFSRATITVGGDRIPTWIEPVTSPCSCVGTSPPNTTVTSLSGFRPARRNMRTPAVCWLPPKVVVPITFPLRSAKLLSSGRATSHKTGRRKLTASTLIGAPRGIARIALPMDPRA